jgi:hypothetical protein
MPAQDPSSGDRITSGETDREIDLDQRERNVDMREASLDARALILRDQEALSADLKKRASAILDEANERDGKADARDSRANDRDKEASLQSFLHDEDFTPGVKAREAAGMDRSDSKADRTWAAGDRSKLTGNGSTHSDMEEREGDRD